MLRSTPCSSVTAERNPEPPGPTHTRQAHNVGRAPEHPSPDLSWSSFHIGPLTIHIYALCIIAGIISAVIITERRLRARGVPAGTVLDVALWTVPLGIVAAHRGVLHLVRPG